MKHSIAGVARSGIAFTLLAVLAGCATTLGRNFDEGYAQQIKAGTTKAEVASHLGNPPLRQKAGDEETWTYAHYSGPGYFFGYWNVSDEQLQYGLGNQKRLVVTFKGDLVSSAKFTREIPQQ